VGHHWIWESLLLSKAFLITGLLVSALALSACNRNPLLVKRSPCPAVAIPTYAGSVTRFDPAQSRNADAIDFTAQISDVSATCTEGGEYLGSELAFTVTAQRRKAGPAREVYLPVFVGLAQGGNVLVSKQLTGVTLSFPEGGLRAEARGGARAEVHRSAVTLPAEVQQRITRERKPDEADALVDPLSDPQVRAAVRAASFEVLVGFQLDDASLAYNVGK
jgi:predicted kinase